MVVELNEKLALYLGEPRPKLLRSHRKMLKFLKGAYDSGVPGMMTKPSTDLLAHSGGYAFHCGFPNPEMRDISSWILTSGEGNTRRVSKLIPSLLNLHFQSDLFLSVLFLSTMSFVVLLYSSFISFFHLFYIQ